MAAWYEYTGTVCAPRMNGGPGRQRVVALLPARTCVVAPTAAAGTRTARPAASRNSHRARMHRRSHVPLLHRSGLVGQSRDERPWRYVTVDERDWLAGARWIS